MSEQKEPIHEVKIKESSPTRITSTKVKDPRKVEAGRRLGQMSRQLKEQKIRAKIEEEKKSGLKIDYKLLIGFVGLLLTAISIYYTKLRSKVPYHEHGHMHVHPDANVYPGVNLHQSVIEPEDEDETHNPKLDRL